MKIGIYGGSFDPIHQGHIKSARYAIKELNLDKLIFVPTNCSPFKKNKSKTSNQDKLNMINLVLEDKMEVSDFEIKRGGVSYTIDTVKYFANKYKKDQLYLIIGSDNLTKLNKWKDIDTISQLAQIAVLRREAKINKLNLKKYNGILLKNRLYDFSSTNFKKGFLDLVDDKVLNYIQARGLYLEQIIHNSLTALRAKHSVSTASFAAELAKAHNLDAKQAYTAGLVHDIAKEWSIASSRSFIQEYQPELINASDFELHQICGALWLKYGYKLQDQAVIEAVRYHTTMKLEMSDLDKILFIADKICQGRKFPGIQKVRELCFKDLNQGFKEVVYQTYLFNINKGVEFSPLALEIYQKHMGGK
ncbi:nicotinate-nucleotide adenylyltransferase [Mycoplasma sp. NEAQ87857]|uniref:nicotinate-nucleotide adenylyltransferase n=1 Tax=Mycoplasma sp. NEAQ87857 TaxID=2683967 RepID=UPI001317B89C|nr:nicotinate-nucleotide adenylyltransferase [Mycoplasma sp. NEAQ87857]QGZ97884.1 nicotinate-nucleotide adenylyltransferase [Mycoplasma sp. NEAQ87857]